MFDLENLNPVRRFPYDDNEIEWVELRMVTEAKYKEFRDILDIKQKRTYKFDKQGKPCAVDELDMSDKKINALSDMANEYMIADWHLITKSGDEIPCTKEIKIKMMTECPDFANWINKCITEMKGETEEVLEAAEKN